MRPELLAPAGDLERLKVALLYGADAVYIGGTKFSLRYRASNFTLQEIEAGVVFAHALGKKVYVTVNIVVHNEDLSGLDEYLSDLEKIGVDAVIASSPYVIDQAINHPELAFHLSTQQSVASSALVNFWGKKGVKRVVLAREVTLDEINAIKKATKVELEVFIHGGMCSSYSGRCTLSNDLADRDANRGGCAHSCRWNYDLFRNGELISNNADFQMASKDLQTVRIIPDLIAARVSSLKIEGRMKSLHYIATVVNAYRQVIDDTISHHLRSWNEYETAIAKAENRKTSSGFLIDLPVSEQQLYQRGTVEPSQNFVGVILEYDPKTEIATISQRNVFQNGDTVELFTPDGRNERLTIKDLQDIDGNPIIIANHAMQIVKMRCHQPVKLYDILRKVS